MADDSDIDAFIGDRVRVFRLDRNVSQAELARRMDIAPPYLCQLEKGLRTWSATTMELAADGLGIDIRLLLPPGRRQGVSRAAG